MQSNVYKRNATLEYRQLEPRIPTGLFHFDSLSYLNADLLIKGLVAMCAVAYFALICILQLRFAKCVLNKAPICIKIEEKTEF
ncbi:hypothetical protein VoSk93_36310 [Vibrio owensii]